MKGIRWKVITAIMVVIVAVCFIFISQLIHYAKVNLTEKIVAKEENGRLLTQTILAQIGKQYQARIEGFVNYKAAKTRENYIKAFAHRDREELLRLTEPFLHILKKENPYFYSLAWILPDNQVFLRVHKPKMFGDDVSSFRPDIVAVNRDYKQVSGFDVGPDGMQFRVVHPVYYDDQYLGVVQFGIKASLLLDTLQQQLNVPAALAVRTEECKKEKFSPMPKLPCGNYTIRAKDISLFKNVRECPDFNKNRQRVAVNEKQYVVLNTLALNNFQNLSLGNVIIAMDISRDLAEKHKLILFTVSLSVVISLVSFLILYSRIGILLKKIVSLNESLNQSNKRLEDRVRERTQSLEQEVKEHIETEEKLRNSKQRYKTLFENAGDAIGIHDLEGNFLAVNKVLCDRLEYSHEEIMNKHLQDLDSPKYAKLAPYRMQYLLKKGQVQFETEHIRRDGENVPTEIQANLVEYDGKPAIISVARDISDRKRGEAEKKFLEAKLRRLKKMKAIGLMAGGVAHDLNNILSGIISYPELLLMQLPEKSELRESVVAIQQSGLRAAAVVDDLLTVARGVASTKKIANLNTLIIEYLNSPEYRKLSEVHPYITCNKELAPDLLNISCSPVHITKCLMNLVTNAVEAIDREGHIIIATRNQYIDKPVSSKEFMDKGEYVVLRIADTGSGISKQDLEHIFEPFYSKKVMGRSGTGLGLAVVWNTMQDHNGTITVNSDDSGTTFELYFSATRDNVLGQEKNIQIDGLRGNGEQVLIIDDELQQQDIAKKILKSLGYTVFSVSSGEKAVQFLHKKSVDLLIIDMIMDPGINGMQTFKQIIATHPGQKAIIVSGFSKSKDVQETLQLGAGFFIKKPYSLEQLGQAVQKELKR